jgi:hypothetical protein
MRENVGHVDRIVRTVVGTGLVALGFAPLRAHDGRLPGLFAVVAGALLLESAVTRVCPLNHALGLDTRSTTERMRDFRGDINEQTDRIEHDYRDRSLPMA